MITEQLIEAELSLGAPLSARWRSRVGEADAPRRRPRRSRRRQRAFAAGLERHVAELFRSFGEHLPPVGLYHRVLRELEAPLIAATLAATRGNQIKAAEILGLNRNTLRKKIRDLDLKPMRGLR